MERSKILIADEARANREQLARILEPDYETVQVQDGAQAVCALREQPAFSLVFLNLFLPRMSGCEVLAVMRERDWLSRIPVIMICAQNVPAQIDRAYEMGATDFITCPFDDQTVRHRADNAMLLYVKQRRLKALAAQQRREQERHGRLLTDILGHIVDFHNGENSQHIRHVRNLAAFLLRMLAQRTDRYALTPKRILTLANASALHDIGKIAVDRRILNKEGPLDPQEQAQARSHCMQGAKMLEDMPFHRDDPLVHAAYEICRWHHERYDGSGYPDGLKGDAIPIGAQAVSLADAYDALISHRAYKAAYSHEQAVRMLQSGACGAFNPLLLACFLEHAGQIPLELERDDSQEEGEDAEPFEELEETVPFFSEIRFEYTLSPARMYLSPWGAGQLGLDQTLPDPAHNASLSGVFGAELWPKLTRQLEESAPDAPEIRCECLVRVDGVSRWHQIIMRAVWSQEEPSRCLGALGRIVDVHETHMRLAELEERAAHDSLTGLLNHASAREQICQLLSREPQQHYALALLDLDDFKAANDRFGHAFGNRVLVHVAQVLRETLHTGDLSSREGGDEYLVFLTYDADLESRVAQLFSALCGRYEFFPIRLSMGVARSSQVGADYDALFHAADQALYSAKREHGCWRFYDESMRQMLSVSVLSAIEYGEDL